MKLNYIPLLAILLIGAVFISGCVSQESSTKTITTTQPSETPETTPQQSQPQTPTSQESSAKAPATTQPSGTPKITPQETQTQTPTVISPARDLTGEWEGLPGSVKWHDNVINWACSYEGYLHLSLKQDGNALGGTFTATITKVMPNTWNTGKVPCSTPGRQPSALLKGTVSSSEYKFTVADVIDFKGMYTSDTIRGSFESCLDQKCRDGTSATGTTGDFKALRQR